MQHVGCAAEHEHIGAIHAELCVHDAVAVHIDAVDRAAASGGLKRLAIRERSGMNRSGGCSPEIQLNVVAFSRLIESVMVTYCVCESKTKVSAPRPPVTVSNPDPLLMRSLPAPPSMMSEAAVPTSHTIPVGLCFCATVGMTGFVRLMDR